MKTKHLAAFGLLLASLACGNMFGAEATPIETEVKSIMTDVQKAARNGEITEKDLAPSLKRLDELLAKHKDEKTDEVARIPFMKAIIYLQALDQPEKAATILEQVKKDYPETKTGKSIDGMLANIEKQKQAKAIQAGLVEGTKFPDFDEKDLAGKPLSIANYKGKVVLVDFWATWCGPCVGELPNVLKTYEKYHPQGLEIIGISLDRDETKLQCDLAAVFRRSILEQQAGAEVRHQQHPDDLLAGWRRKNHRQESAWRETR
jgi:thiol-disulfide isomerase/thioredoxin